MSKENRKRMYDQLISERRYDEIDEYLEAEFGPVPEKENQKKSEMLTSIIRKKKRK